MSFAWESNPQYLAQVGHFLGGLTVVFVVGAFFGHEAMWEALGIGLVTAAAKEFISDLLPAPYGEGDSFKDSLMDFAFYVLGGLAGMGLFLLAVSRHAAFV